MDMETKITLKLNKNVIERARDYAESHNRSLSGIVEAYLQSLTLQDDTSKKEEIEISPFVKSMSSGINIPVDLDYKEEYSNYLTQKYK
jgi:hypothetical protein